MKIIRHIVLWLVAVLVVIAGMLVDVDFVRGRGTFGIYLAVEYDEETPVTVYLQVNEEGYMARAEFYSKNFTFFRKTQLLEDPIL